MLGSVSFRIEGFKSIDKLRAELAPLTVFVGHPASGKSNIIEALELIGYVFKAVVEAPAGEHGEPLDPSSLGALNDYVRALICHDLLNRLTGAANGLASLGQQEARFRCGRSPDRLVIEYRVGTTLIAEVKAPLAAPRARLVEAPGALPRDVDQLVRILLNLSMIEKSSGKGPVLDRKIEGVGKLPAAEGTLLAPRLYSFDRMNILSNIINGLTDSLYPLSYLDEKARNMAWLLYRNQRVLDAVNDVLSRISGVTISPLSSGKLAFYDGKREVGPVSVSDSVVRMAYSLTALLAASPTEYDGVKAIPLVMLEEPESHVYPIAFTSLVDAVFNAIERGSTWPSPPTAAASHSSYGRTLSSGAWRYWCTTRRGSPRAQPGSTA
ncbi:MAG: hypothetical protein GSR80_000593 [Desulfurococcales archaeon]|nr:hypothetical protein [Desulfurococcales archaeon]